ncbi:hypothetical protein O6H91_05G113700 [Diphasiastrum complanatum]|nr:hypothetical protein O6H91_05G113700 [Diphasiastrum complanatum]
MSEQFNKGLHITGKMPLGLFNSMYSFNGTWEADASATQSLAFDGWFITLYNLQLSKMFLELNEEVKKAVPSTWEPAALARFIEKYGTHIIVGVKIGGKDVVYVRQYPSSPLSSDGIKKYLKQISKHRFSVIDLQNNPVMKGNELKEMDADFLVSSNRAHQVYLASAYASSSSFTAKEDVGVIFRRRGGDNCVKNHRDWLATVSVAPDVISMSFVPIAALLSGVPGSSFLSHAVNLYMKYKPPIEELQYFLEFQVPRQWSSGMDIIFGSRREEPVYPALQFSLMGLKLYVITTQVTIGRRPVTGLRLFLEGDKYNKLAIHLQHLSSLPKILQPHWDSHLLIGPPVWKQPEEQDSKWFEPVQWKSFSHVSTAPVEYLEESYGSQMASAFIVTGAQLRVWDFGQKNVLFLRLLFSKVPGCSIKRSVWDHTPSGPLHKSQPRKFAESTPVDSGAATPAKSPKLLKYVDLAEMTKNAQDIPGHWLVSGAKLDVDKGRISLRVKYSLLHY